MKIVICSSIHFVEKIRKVEMGLKERGHEVVIPHSINQFDVKNIEDDEKLRKIIQEKPNIKQELTIRHFDEIKGSDAILVVNDEKRGIPNYIGGATLSEMLFALYHDKKIFMLNPIPTHERISFYKDEIEGCQPIIINGNLDMVK